MRAFDQLLPGGIGGFICLASVVLFGFSCLISYYTYAERAGEYIFGKKVKPVIKIFWVIVILIGSQSTLGFAWDLADTFNGLMIISNLIGIIFLTPDFLDVLEEGFKEFFEKEVLCNPLKAEYLIPIFIGELLEQGKMSVKVLKTNDTWYGMTYHEDVAAVKDSFKKMLENGVYKADLFSDL